MLLPSFLQPTPPPPPAVADLMRVGCSWLHWPRDCGGHERTDAAHLTVPAVQEKKATNCSLLPPLPVYGFHTHDRGHPSCRLASVPSWASWGCAVVAAITIFDVVFYFFGCIAALQCLLCRLPFPPMRAAIASLPLPGARVPFGRDTLLPPLHTETVSGYPAADEESPCSNCCSHLAHLVHFHVPFVPYNRKRVTDAGEATSTVRWEMAVRHLHRW